MGHVSMGSASLDSIYLKKSLQDFSVDTVDRNPPANAGDTGSNLGRGRFHMLQSN